MQYTTCSILRTGCGILCAASSVLHAARYVERKAMRVVRGGLQGASAVGGSGVRSWVRRGRRVDQTSDRSAHPAHFLMVTQLLF